MNPLAYLRRLGSRYRDRKYREEVSDFQAAVAELKPGDIAVDCGANVGKFTVPMASSGATVYAFEPNPDAFEALREKTASFSNVRLFQTAVATANGEMRLFLHKYSGEDPLHFSTGSSLVGEKRNVRRDNFVMVETVAFAEFIRDLGAPVKLLKMDIEGAEVDVLNQLLDENLHERIDQAYIEVHDRQIKALADPTRRLRERLASIGADHIRLDWR